MSTQRIAIVAVDGCIGSTVHGLLDAFACANACASERSNTPPPFAVIIVSTDGKPATSYNGHAIAVNGHLPLAEGSDVIVFAPIMQATTIASRIDAKIDPHRSLLPWVRKQSEAGSCLATSCTGSFLLAEAGILDGKVATTHWRAAHAFRERYPQVVLREDELVTEDGNLVCSGGAVSYIDLAIHLIRRFAGPALALQCARMLVFDPGRDRQSPYRAFDPHRAHGDEKVLKAQDWIESRYWQDIDAVHIAELLGMSPRNFNRRFKAACGESLNNYVQGIRISAACDRLVSSELSLQKIIADVGYSDASSFTRLFKNCTGITMGEYRKRFQSQRLPPNS